MSWFWLCGCEPVTTLQPHSWALHFFSHFFFFFFAKNVAPFRGERLSPLSYRIIDYSKCFARHRDSTSNFSLLMTWKNQFSLFILCSYVSESKQAFTLERIPPSQHFTVIADVSGCTSVHVWALILFNSTFSPGIKNYQWISDSSCPQSL